MNIGEAAAASGVTAKMIRHYESIGVIPKAGRSLSGYRVYTENDVHVLRFVRRSRSLGFSMAEIKQLLLLWRGRRPSKEVKRLATAHVVQLRAKIAEMRAMVKALDHLAAHCHGDERPECPILEGIASPGSVTEKARRMS
ncbi:MAG: Cu(I)-responsive transcriptional regulator [Burkholderiales bacterium]|nr:Cu(I)-responsive transcriptional regulator [Burkholderiales bacterium]